jgi:ATP-binding cassette subfamily B protein
MIAHVVIDETLEHFVVVCGMDSKKVSAFDPARGSMKYRIDEFKKIWTGYVIAFSQGKEFVAANLKKRFFSKFLVIITEQKSFFVITIIVSLILAATSIISSLAYQRVVDNFMLNGSGSSSAAQIFPGEAYSLLMKQINDLLSNIHSIFLALVIICLFQMILTFGRGIILARISKKSGEILMFSFFRHMLALPVGFFHDRETGEVLSRFQDIGEIQNIISGATLTLILDTFMLFAGAIVLISIDTKLFMLVLLLIIAYAIIVLLFRKPIATVSRDIMEQDAQVTSILKESIDGIETVKSLNGETASYQKFEEKTSGLIAKIFKGSIIGNAQSVSMSVVEGIGVTFVMWVGSIFVMQGHLSLGSLIAFITLIQLFISPAQRLIGLQPALQKAVISAERLNDILEIPTEESVNPLRDNTCDMVHTVCAVPEIVFESVTFRYGYRKTVLHDISFRISAGERVAVVGSSGCGKTTLLQLIDAFYSVSEGEIRIGNTPLNEIPLTNLRSKVAYVSQTGILFAGSIRDNIVMGNATYDSLKLKEITQNCCIDEIVEKLPFGMDSLISEGGKTLSGGQNQRIAIARALVANPEILLFDESTSQIDAKSESIILNYIIKQYSNCICIFVAHKHSVIKVCDKVIFMEEGKITAYGKHDDLTVNCKQYARFIKESSP